MSPEVKPPKLSEIKQAIENGSDQNTEINQALKKFEEEENYSRQSTPTPGATEDQTPKMVTLVMRLSGGAIKEQKQAEYVLVGFVVLVALVSLLIFFIGRGGNEVSDQMRQLHPELFVQ